MKFLLSLRFNVPPSTIPKLLVSGWLGFSKKNLEDLRWYIEVYAAQYTGEPDDEEARRIEVKLIGLGEKLFKAVFTTAESQALFQQFQQQASDKVTTHPHQKKIEANQTD